MKSKAYTQNKQPSDKTQSSKFCQLGVKRTHFQNLKKKRKRIFDHSTTLKKLALAIVLSQPITSSIEINRNSLTNIFPSFASVTYICNELRFIHLIVYLLFDWPKQSWSLSKTDYFNFCAVTYTPFN